MSSRLRSVDNVYAVVGRQKPDRMPQNEEELKEKLQLFHDSLDWRAGLAAWRKVAHFEKSDEETILTRLSIAGDPASQPDTDQKPKFRVTCYRAGDGHGFQSGEGCMCDGRDHKRHIRMAGFDERVRFGSCPVRERQ